MYQMEFFSRWNYIFNFDMGKYHIFTKWMNKWTIFSVLENSAFFTLIYVYEIIHLFIKIYQFVYSGGIIGCKQFIILKNLLVLVKVSVNIVIIFSFSKLTRMTPTYIAHRHLWLAPRQLSQAYCLCCIIFVSSLCSKLLTSMYLNHCYEFFWNYRGVGKTKEISCCCLNF